MANKFFWYDVMTSDTAAARRFYTAVMGWGAEDAEAPGMAYTLFTLNGRGVAGLMPIPEEARKAGARPRWMGYIGVEDIGRATAELERRGGKVHRGPIEVPQVIRFAVVSDPQGAGFLIAQTLLKDAPPELPPRTPGTVGWRELYAGDGASALAFYEELYGWTKGDAIDMGAMGTYQIFVVGDAPAGGVMTKPAEVPMPAWGYYFNTAAIDAASSRVVAAGGIVNMAPQQVPGGQWIVQCVDPQGAHFSLVAPQR